MAMTTEDELVEIAHQSVRDLAIHLRRAADDLESLTGGVRISLRTLEPDYLSTAKAAAHILQALNGNLSLERVISTCTEVQRAVDARVKA
jgi:hypothetical protein